ncbi:hypothetical protein FQZ97_1074360 [compost metagenome]
MLVMRQMVLPVSVDGCEHRPGKQQVAHPVAEPAVPDDAVVRRLVNEATECVHAAGNHDHGQQIDEDIAGKFAGGDGRRDDRPIDRYRAKRFLWLEDRKALQLSRIDPAVPSTHDTTQTLIHNQRKNRTSTMVNQS